MNAKDMASAVGKRLEADGFAWLHEFVIPTGRRFDLIALNVQGIICGVEIKVSEGDMRQDTKWPDYLEHCHLFYLACGPAVPLKHAWPSAGLITTENGEAKIVKYAELRQLKGRRAQATTLSFARTALTRLNQLEREKPNDATRPHETPEGHPQLQPR
jgi:hypothetical protein